MPRLPSTDRSATTIRLDLTLKRRASMLALRKGVNLSDVIEEGLRLLLAQSTTAKRPAMSAEEREKAKAWFRERRAAKGKAPVPPAPSLPGLDAPSGGQVKGEPAGDPAPQPVQPERQPVQHELERQR